MRPKSQPQTMRRSLAEAALWCASQNLTATPEQSPDQVRRRSLWEESTKVFTIIYANHTNRLDSWKASDHPQWNEAMKLLREADPGSLVQLDAQLRSSALKPHGSISYSQIGEESKKVVEEVIQKRSKLPGQGTECPDSRSPLARKGRLLRYFPNENLACGAARQSSNGFLDDDNAPPWDTWVDYSDGVLTSWVPSILVPLAQSGIEVNPEQCIEWANDYEF